MKRLQISLFLIGAVFVTAGFNWPGEKTEKPSKAAASVRKTEASQEAPASHGSDLMEGTVTAVDLEAKPAVLTVQFTSGQKTSVEIAKDTTVFSKGEVLGPEALAIGKRLRVEYVTTGAIKVARNVEIVEVAPPVAAAEEQAPSPADIQGKPESTDKKINE